MSKNINVNPDHYKVAGRERQGEDIVQTEHKTRFAKSHDELSRRARQRAESLQEMTSRAAEEGGQGKLFGSDDAPAASAAKAKRKKAPAKKKGAAKKRAAAKKAPAKKAAAKKATAKSRGTRAKAKAPSRKSAKRPARKK